MNEPNRKIKTHNSFISVWQQHNLKMSIKISSVRKATKKAVLYQSASVCLNSSIRSETRTKQKTRKKWERSKNQHQRKRKTFRVWRERSKVIFSFLKSKHTNILHRHTRTMKKKRCSFECGLWRHKTLTQNISRSRNIVRSSVCANVYNVQTIWYVARYANISMTPLHLCMNANVLLCYGLCACFLYSISFIQMNIFNTLPRAQLHFISVSISRSVLPVCLSSSHIVCKLA